MRMVETILCNLGEHSLALRPHSGLICYWCHILMSSNSQQLHVLNFWFKTRSQTLPAAPSVWISGEWKATTQPNLGQPSPESRLLYYTYFYQNCEALCMVHLLVCWSRRSLEDGMFEEEGSEAFLEEEGRKSLEHSTQLTAVSILALTPILFAFM